MGDKPGTLNLHSHLVTPRIRTTIAIRQYCLFACFTTHITKKKNKSTKKYITEKVVRKPKEKPFIQIIYEPELQILLYWTMLDISFG